MGGDQTKKYREILNNSKHGGFDPKLNEYGGGGGVTQYKRNIVGGFKNPGGSLPLFSRIAFRNEEYMECDSCRMFCRKPHEQSKSLGLIK